MTHIIWSCPQCHDMVAGPIPLSDEDARAALRDKIPSHYEERHPFDDPIIDLLQLAEPGAVGWRRVEGVNLGTFLATNQPRPVYVAGLPRMMARILAAPVHGGLPTQIVTTSFTREIMRSAVAPRSIADHVLGRMANEARTHLLPVCDWWKCGSSAELNVPLTRELLRRIDLHRRDSEVANLCHPHYYEAAKDPAIMLTPVMGSFGTRIEVGVG